MLSKTLRPHITDLTIELKLSSRITISDDSLATVMEGRWIMIVMMMMRQDYDGGR